jgi:hypothetical protein
MVADDGRCAMIADDGGCAVVADDGAVVAGPWGRCDHGTTRGVAACGCAMVADRRAGGSPICRRAMIADDRRFAVVADDGSCAMVANNHSTVAWRRAMVADDDISRIGVDHFARGLFALPVILDPHEAGSGRRGYNRRSGGNRGNRPTIAHARIDRNGIGFRLVLVAVVFLEIRDHLGDAAPASEVVLLVVLRPVVVLAVMMVARVVAIVMVVVIGRCRGCEGENAKDCQKGRKETLHGTPTFLLRGLVSRRAITRLQGCLA